MQLTPLSTHWAPRKKIKKGTIFFGHGVFMRCCMQVQDYGNCRRSCIGTDWVLYSVHSESHLAHFFTSENLYGRYMRQQYVFPQVYMLGKRSETLVLGYKFRCISLYRTFSTLPWCFTCYSRLRQPFKTYSIYSIKWIVRHILCFLNLLGKDYNPCFTDQYTTGYLQYLCTSLSSLTLRLPD